jgi:hypothetical protein
MVLLIRFTINNGIMFIIYEYTIVKKFFITKFIVTIKYSNHYAKTLVLSFHP